MSDKLISVVMPTSSRQHTHASLLRALGSLKDTSTDFGQVEILLRIDDDDPERVNAVPELVSEFGVKEFIGPRGEGYNNMGGFVNDLMTLATGKWSWLFDDDSWVSGNWQGALQAVPCDPQNGPACIAEFYHLGESQYTNFPTCSPPGLIMPTEAVKKLDSKNPVDCQWLSVIQQSNWKIICLPGVTYFHDGRIRA